MSDTKTKICPKCGRKNEESRKYCKYCGWPLEVQQKKDG